YGYASGDSRIKQSAEILKKYFQIDFYRISGDEFVGFYDNIDEHDFEKYVWTLCKKMREEKNDFFAVGHAWNSGNFDVLQLIQEADTMMYINKQEYYHAAGRQKEEINDAVLSELLSYLANDEFVVYLQPQMYLKDNTLYGAEALIRRYDKKNNKIIYPNHFIPLYEKKSVIRHVDIFVLNQVCKLLVEWREIGKEIPISVNLSRVTLLEYGIVDTIAEICDYYNVPHELLVIEVTERVGLIENNVASALIENFKRKGFKISLDDFGCAYSNIVTLAQIPMDEVKIDKSLVDHVATNKKNAIIVKHVLSMCNEIDGTSTLAEGVEDRNQANVLRGFECHLGQGYLFSKPIPVEEFFEKYIS
ncbi:MAG: GGDEF domain-containing phosphodiesterase, partial [Eubacteriales bacterium]